jgi:hypothetical protein
MVDSLQGTHTLASVVAHHQQCSHPTEKNSVVGVLFASFTDAPSKRFTRKLIELTEALHKRQHAPMISIIVVPLDKSSEEYQAHLSSLPPEWKCIPIHEVDVRKKLVQIFHVVATPSLLLFDSVRDNGHAVIKTPLGVDVIHCDPLGAHFPWIPSEAFQLPIQSLTLTEDTCIQMAMKQTGLSAIKAHGRGGLTANELLAIQHLITSMDSMRQRLRREVFFHDLTTLTGLTREHERPPHAIPMAAVVTPCIEEPPMMDVRPALHPFQHMEHIRGATANPHVDDQYAGNVAEATVPVLASLLDVPSSSETLITMDAIAAALHECEKVCHSLQLRASDGSSSSRVALHHEVIELITTFFLDVLPMPYPRERTQGMFGARQ